MSGCLSLLGSCEYHQSVGKPGIKRCAEGTSFAFIMYLQTENEGIEKHQLQLCSKYDRERDFDFTFVRYVIKHHMIIYLLSEL